MQADEPDDYVIATRESYSAAGLPGGSVRLRRARLGTARPPGPEIFRPVDPTILVGDSSEALTKLGWKPKMTFQELVHSRVDAELVTAGIERPTPDRGAPGR